MTAVWVVLGNGKVEAAFPREDEALNYRNLYGAADMTVTRIVTRETILPPAHAAVIEAAKVMAHQIPISDSYHRWVAAQNGLLAAVATLRELEGEV